MSINSQELWTEHWDDSSDHIENIKNEVIAKILDSLGIDIPDKFNPSHGVNFWVRCDAGNVFNTNIFRIL